MATSKKSNSSPARRSTPARSVETVDAAPAQAQPQVSTRSAARDAAPADAPSPRSGKRSSVKAEATPSRTNAKTKPTRASTTGRPVEPDKATTEREASVRELAYLLAESNHFAGDPAFYWRVAAQLQERA